MVSAGEQMDTSSISQQKSVHITSMFGSKDAVEGTGPRHSLPHVLDCSECSCAFVSDVFFQKHMKRTPNDDVYCRMLRNGPNIKSAACRQITSSQPYSHQQLVKILTQSGVVKTYQPTCNPLGHLNTLRRIHAEKSFFHFLTGQKQGDTNRPRLYGHQQFTRTLTRPVEAKTHQLTCVGNKTHDSKPPVVTFSRSGHPNTRVSPIDKRFLCEQCDKRFARLGTLNRHQRIHTGERPFQCTLCDKNFNQLDHLKIHRRRHTGEKPFRCETCDRSFSQMVVLKRHRRIHTGEKPFRCTQCDTAFSRLTSLKRHQRVHAGERPAV